MIKVINDDERPWVVRLIFPHERTADANISALYKDEIFVEFYDARYEHTQYGQFVTRYFASTLMSIDLELHHTGLLLDGGVPDWKISAAALQRILSWLQVIVTDYHNGVAR